MRLSDLQAAIAALEVRVRVLEQRPSCDIPGCPQGSLTRQAASVLWPPSITDYATKGTHEIL